MEFKRCESCYGSGEILGGGMIKRDCIACDGTGKNQIINDELNYLEVKQTERFKEAKEQLKDEFPDMSDEQADELMSDALDPKKKKRRNKREKRHGV